MPFSHSTSLSPPVLSGVYPQQSSNMSALTSVLLRLLEANNLAAFQIPSSSSVSAPSLLPQPINFSTTSSFNFSSSSSSFRHDAISSSAPASPGSDISESSNNTTSLTLEENIIALYPRKKRGRAYATHEAVILDRKTLEKFYHLPLKEAATEFGICPTAIKTACRKLGLPKWPYRTIKKQRQAHLQARLQAARACVVKVA
jgi:hypothetical protein